MSQHLLLISLSLAVFSAVVLTQNPVQITFQNNPVFVQTSTDIVFTLLSVSNAFTVTWKAPGGVQLGLFVGGTAYIDNVTQYLGRVSITANQLRITSAQLSDAGNYTVVVDPLASSGLTANSQSVQLLVFVAVTAVKLSIPSLAVEGNTLSLNCTWATGTQVTVQWGKGGSAIVPDSRISISPGSLVIQPSNREDSGVYSCTPSNPVSAGTATGTLTVYYGPDTPAITRSTPAQCVGGGDVVAGQTVRLTCTSASLPPALFSWQYNGLPIGPGQPGSGVLDVQTFSANQSGSYTCVGQNAVTGGTSQQKIVLTIVGTCLSPGAVAGIVIGCVVALFLIILLILVLVRWRRVNQILENFMGQQKTNQNTRIIATDLLPQEAGNVGQGPHPPLHDLSTHQPDNLYGVSRQGHNILRVSDTYPHDERASGTGHPHSRGHNASSQPHGGVDNPAFADTAPTNANANGSTNANANVSAQQQNSNVVIQAGGPPGASQHPTLHFSLNTEGNTQPPTLHVNLNSYPTNGQPAQPPQTAPPDAPDLSRHQDPIRTGQSSGNPRMQSELPYIRLEPRSLGQNGEPERVPTGYAHSRRGDRALTDNPESAGARRRRQMPWDRLRGTPPYPNGADERRRTSSSSSTGGTDHTAPSQTASRVTRNSSPPSAPQAARPAARARRGETEGRGARAHTHTHRGSGVPQSQAAPGLSPVLRGSPQALPLSSRQLPAGRDARALADPNHFPRVRPAQQPGELQVETAPQGPAARTQPGGWPPQTVSTPPAQSSGRPPQTASSPPAQISGPPPQTVSSPPAQISGPPPQTVSSPPAQISGPPLQTVSSPPAQISGPPPQTASSPTAQPGPSSLTQAALQVHTQRTKTFQNRNQQTQAALLHSTGGPEAPRPPTPPPVIPLAQFQALPKVGKGPTWIPPKQHSQPQPHAQHHRHGNGPQQHANTHRHAPGHAPGHLPGHWHPAQQTHRGRPR